MHQTTGDGRVYRAERGGAGHDGAGRAGPVVPGVVALDQAADLAALLAGERVPPDRLSIKVSRYPALVPIRTGRR